MNINLNDCKNGDKLRTRSGDLVTYDGRYGYPGSSWPHHILWGGKNFTVTNEGSVFTEEIEHPQDIVKILGPVDLSTCKPGDKLCLRNETIAVFLEEQFPNCPYPYKLERESGKTDVYARNGKLWIGHPDSPIDVVEIITNPKEEPVSKPKLDPKNAPRGTIAVPEQEPNSCKGCLYESNPACDDHPCLDTERTDEHNVIFVAHPDHESILRQAEAIRTLRNLAPLEVDTKEVPYIQMHLAKIDPVSDFAKTVLATYNQDLQAAAQKALDTLRAHYQAIADGKA